MYHFPSIADSNDIISTQLEDRFDQDINTTNTYSPQHNIEYIHLSEQHGNPGNNKDTSDTYDHIGNTDDNTFSATSTTTEKPHLEYISNNKYVIVKPTQNKEKYQTTTYKSILEDLFSLWEEDVSDVNKGKIKNGTKDNGNILSENEHDVKVNKNPSSDVNDSTNEYWRKKNATLETHFENAGTQVKLKNDSKTVDDIQADKTKTSNESEESLLSSFFNSFSSMYLDSSKDKTKPATNRPTGNKNNIRIKPIVPHNPIKTKVSSEKHQLHSNLGVFSTSTEKTTTLFIPILRYNSTATKYYSVLETTPVLSNKKQTQTVQGYQELEESPGNLEVSNRVTQPPQMKHVVQSYKNKLNIPSTTETYLMTSNHRPTETTYSYFKPSESYSTREESHQSHLTTTTNGIHSSGIGKNKENHDRLETSKRPSNEQYQNKIQTTTDFERKTVGYQSSTTEINTGNAFGIRDKLETSIRLPPANSGYFIQGDTSSSSIGTMIQGGSNVLQKTTTTTEIEPDLFSDLLGNLFATDEKPVTPKSNYTAKQETTTKVSIKTPQTTVKDDYEDFSFDKVLSYWFNSDTDTPSTTTLSPTKIESRIDTNVDDMDNDDEYDEVEEDIEVPNKKKNSVNYIPINLNGGGPQEKGGMTTSNKNNIDKEKQYYQNSNGTNEQQGNETRTIQHLESTSTSSNNSKSESKNLSMRPVNTENNNSSNDFKLSIKSGESESSNSKIAISGTTSNEEKKHVVKISDSNFSEVIKKNQTTENSKDSSKIPIKNELTNTTNELKSIPDRTDPPVTSNQKQIVQHSEAGIKLEEQGSKITNTAHKVEHDNSTSKIDSLATKDQQENKTILANNTTENINNNLYKSNPEHTQNKTAEVLNTGASQSGFIPIPTKSKPNVQTTQNNHSGVHQKQNPPIREADEYSTQRTVQTHHTTSHKIVDLQTESSLETTSNHYSTQQPTYEPSTSTPHFSPSPTTTRQYLATKRPTQSYRPSTYRPKLKFSLPPRPGPSRPNVENLGPSRPNVARPSLTPVGQPVPNSRPSRPASTTVSQGLNLLKIDECNIYGSIYKVGTSIPELGSECLQCLCTSMGVQCSSRC